MAGTDQAGPEVQAPRRGCYLGCRSVTDTDARSVRTRRPYYDPFRMCRSSGWESMGEEAGLGNVTYMAVMARCDVVTESFDQIHDSAGRRRHLLGPAW